MKPIQADPELEVLHFEGDLVLAICKHVDDIKYTGKPDWCKWFEEKLEAQFGKLKAPTNNVTNCGVRHQQDPTTKVVTLDQEEYIEALKAVHSEDLHNAADTPLTHAGWTIYLSVLGAVAFTTLTRHDVAVYVAALQRAAHKATTIHLKRLNALVRWMKRNPRRVVFPQMGEPTKLMAVSDSSFKKVDEEYCHSMRGCIVGLMSGDPSKVESGSFHVLEVECRKHKVVARATFSAECHAAIAAAETLLLINLAMHEVQHGPLTTREAVTWREDGTPTLALKGHLIIDAMSLLAAVSAEQVRAPADKSLLGHLRWLRELLDKSQIQSMVWVDTRDMCSDGLTKGSVDRGALHELMEGHWTINQDPRQWHPRCPETGQAQGQIFRPTDDTAEG